MSRKIIAALLVALTGAALSAWAVDASAPAFRDDAPDRHVVVPGDTLWGIASKFLKDPYRWSEVWKLNPAEVKNPHRIYPGQVIVLDKSGLDPQLKLANQLQTEKILPRIREEEGGRPISAIPRAAIEPFLIRPLLLNKDDLNDAARVVAINESHVLGGPGDSIYVVGMSDNKTRRWQIVRPGKELKDPDTRETLGYEANVVGNANVIRSGDPAELKITSAQTEIIKGDRLLAEPAPDIMSYPFHRPAKPVFAKVLNIVGDKPTGGIYYVLSLSKGSKDGVELGHVLGLFRPGETFKDRTGKDVREMTMPDERFGLVYVFRVFDRVSYAFVMDAQRPISPGDTVRNP